MPPTKVDKNDELLYSSLFLLLLVPSVLWSAYVFTILWSWFMVPIFSIREISMAEAVGIDLLLSWAMSWQVITADYYWDSLSNRFALPALLLLIGWITKQFM